MKFLLAMFIGLSSLYIDSALAEEVENSTAQATEDDLWVEVEPTNILPSDITGIYYLVPYRNRRESWGQTASIGYSSFTPINYEPNYESYFYEDVFSSPSLPLIELQFSIKRNFTLGSIGGELAVGMYQNSGEYPSGNPSDLELMPVRLGLNLNLDNITFEPYVVPYISGGIYTIIYEEAIAAAAYGGNTQVAPYFSFGLLFQLNWLDAESARISYLESGIENTFLFLEARQFMASGAAADPDFSTGMDWGAGVRMEF
jgi:hypothetical protein